MAAPRSRSRDMSLFCLWASFHRRLLPLLSSAVIYESSRQLGEKGQEMEISAPQVMAGGRCSFTRRSGRTRHLQIEPSSSAKPGDVTRRMGDRPTPPPMCPTVEWTVPTLDPQPSCPSSGPGTWMYYYYIASCLYVRPKFHIVSSIRCRLDLYKCRFLCHI